MKSSANSDQLAFNQKGPAKKSSSKTSKSSCWKIKRSLKLSNKERSNGVAQIARRASQVSYKSIRRFYVVKTWLKLKSIFCFCCSKTERWHCCTRGARRLFIYYLVHQRLPYKTLFKFSLRHLLALHALRVDF